jgi:hypothetical protein
MKSIEDAQTVYIKFKRNKSRLTSVASDAASPHTAAGARAQTGLLLKVLRRIRRNVVAEICHIQGYAPPVICTPEELMEDKNVD